VNIQIGLDWIVSVKITHVLLCAASQQSQSFDLQSLSVINGNCGKDFIQAKLRSLAYRLGAY